MQEHFHFTTDRAKLQKQYEAILFFVSAQLSSIQIPLQRRNRHLLKQKDEVIITIHVWKVVGLHFRTGLAPVCDWEFVSQGLVP